ncbi:hypothetical protein HDR69_04955 [bacterium]|nr:hypothetical protein [Bacteroides sp.]MBD5338575.1 hypothetical protein [Bacteroides sp.]MBD5385757.1 hypothetical protein [bacterium]MDE6805759.1 hypothetical protein [Muribaculaceae bacterium]MDE7510500.1 hypothetical protein [Muribaculaceae bacterium]
MIFRPKTEDNEDEDYFNTPHQPEAPKPPKQPSPTPDDPKYYDIDDEWEHLRPASRNWRYWLWILAGAIICAAFVAVYFRWFTPYSTLETQYGYVEKISRRGDLFKTFEGVIIPYKAINDTVEPYTGDIVFSVAEDRVAATLLRLQQANLPARVEIARYHGALPWRGESKVVIVAADTADVTKIYPVTLNHPLIPNGKK